MCRSSKAMTAKRPWYSGMKTKQLAKHAPYLHRQGAFMCQFLSVPSLAGILPHRRLT